jgi:hypothetical protein
VYQLISLQNIFPTESLITYNAGKWAIPNMYALMCFQIILQTEWLITHNNNTAVPHYVCVDVSSEHFADWKPYYTHFRKMGAPHCMRWCDFILLR